MASLLRIAEYQAGNLAGIQAPVTPAIVVQAALDFTAGIQTSAAFSGDTHLIEISTNASCAVKVGGKTPVATTSDQFMPAGGLRVYIVAPGDKLSVIADT